MAALRDEVLALIRALTGSDDRSRSSSTRTAGDPGLPPAPITPAARRRRRPGELVCTGCGLAYPVRDDIPVLLVDEARRARRRSV